MIWDSNRNILHYCNSLQDMVPTLTVATSGGVGFIGKHSLDEDVSDDLNNSFDTRLDFKLDSSELSGLLIRFSDVTWHFDDRFSCVSLNFRLTSRICFT